MPACYEFFIDFYKQINAIGIVIAIGNFVIVIVIGKIKCNCNLIIVIGTKCN